jgi:hypothetical protein
MRAAVSNAKPAGEDGGVSQPTPMTPIEQDALVKQIGLTLMRSAPEEWQHVMVAYRATGRYFELAGEVRSTEGPGRSWTPPQDVAPLFARLRAGMYRDGRGTWFNARYQLDRPSSYNLDFDRDEPRWQSPPPPQAYADELRFFPRTEENTPEWLQRRVGPPRPDGAPMPPGPRLRPARVFDGAGAGGRPTVNRLPVVDPDLEPLLSYLERAPLVRGGRGLDVDLLSPDSALAVPVAFHSDGVWLWPAAVPYYLRRYGVPPEPELVEYARSRGFQPPPDVDEPTRRAANALLDRPTTPPRGFPPPGEQPPPAPPGFAGPPPGAPGPAGTPPGEATSMLPGSAAPMGRPVPEGSAEPRGGQGAEPGGRVDATAEESFRPLAPGTTDGGEPTGPGGPDQGPRRWESSYPHSPVGTAAAEPIEPPVRYIDEDVDLFRPYQPPAEPEHTEPAGPVGFGAEPDRLAPEGPGGSPDEPPRYQPEPAEYRADPAEYRTEPAEHPTEPGPPRPEVAEAGGFADGADPYSAEPEPRHDDPVGRFATEEARQVELADGPAGTAAPAAADGDWSPTAEDRDWLPVHPGDDHERDLAALRELFSDYDIPAATYRIGELDPDAWSLVPEGDRWHVTRPARKPGEPLRFGDLDDAAAYLIGRLVLESARGEHEQPQPALPAGADAGHEDGWVDTERSDFERSDFEQVPFEPSSFEERFEKPPFEQRFEEPPFEQQVPFEQRFDEPRFEQRRFEEPRFDEPDFTRNDADNHAADRSAERGTDDAGEMPTPPTGAPAPQPSTNGWRHDYRNVEPDAAEQNRQDHPAGRPTDYPAAPAGHRDSGHDHARPAEAERPAAVAAPAAPVGEPAYQAYRQDQEAPAGHVEDAQTPPTIETEPASDLPPDLLYPPGHPLRDAAPHASAPVRGDQRQLSEPRFDQVPPEGADPTTAGPQATQPSVSPATPSGPGAQATGGGPVPPAVPPGAAPANGPVPTARPEQGRPDGTQAGGAAAQREDTAPRANAWPIQPMAGEPPLTLFRHKRMVELGPGTELDRFGDPDGNLTYTMNTPFEQRSLVPEWVNRPYHVYRLLRPLEALNGIAVPWFEQPGGGSAYLLPHSVADLLADGSMVEVEWDGGVRNHQ